MKTCLMVIIFNIAFFAFLSCSTDNRLLPIRLVPANSTIVLWARWEEVCRDTKLKSLVKGQEFETALAPFGINSTSITRLALFSDGFDSGNSNFGMILSGSYKAATVISSVQSHGWSKHDYRGVALYSNPNSDQFLSVLKGNLLAIGARRGVERTIDVLLNPQLAFTRQKPINRMVRDKNYPITIFLALSQEAQDMNNALIKMSSFLLDIAEIGTLGDLLNTIGFARALSCSISRKGTYFPVEIEAVMKDENSASFISGSLNLLKGASNLIPRDRMSATDRDAIDRFQDLQITRNREILFIKLSIPEDKILK